MTHQLTSGVEICADNEDDEYTGFRRIATVETRLYHPDHVRSGAQPARGGVRIYCQDVPVKEKFGRWCLQIRALTKTQLGEPGKRFGISSAELSRDDLLWLREQIDAQLRNPVTADTITHDQLRSLFARHCECRPIDLARNGDDHEAVHDCDTAILRDVQIALGLVEANHIGWRGAAIREAKIRCAAYLRRTL